ncbi:MAG TPA: glycosyltransferase [Methylotenera sp.]|nr:glycosyltransferase [Methylotenera sp.]
MRILIAHNAYQHHGGEDGVVAAEIALLKNADHKVIEYFRHNDEIKSMGNLQLVQDALWSRQTTQDFSALIAKHQPDVIHAHNTFPLISPSAYWAAKRAGVPIVQTLHNFRFLCPQAMFLREGSVCEDCLGKTPWRGVVHRCYRDSFAHSAVLTTQITLHQKLGTYCNKVTRYIALNEFCRNKFIDGGLPADKIMVKPNFIDCPEKPDWQSRHGGLFVGRLSKEKGLDVLAGAIKTLPSSPVKVIGGGELDAFASDAFGANYLGFQPLGSILMAMRHAAYLVIPSIWYENFPRTIVEAFSCGLPVIASRIGALADIVNDGVTGLLFDVGDSEDLAKKIAWAEAHPVEMITMGKNARAEYEAKYTPVANYATLMAIYEQAMSDNAVE